MRSNQLLILSICALFLSFSKLSAQSKLSGNIVDGSDNAKLEKAVIALLNPKDSILMQFARTKEDGSFSISKLDTGSYKIIVSYPQYGDYVQDIQFNGTDKHLGAIKLSKMALLIEEVAVMGKIPIVINGDTIEYNADSFKVDKDAKVEDLLKVLPGITVDANGKITAQGKEVKKVLLDGEEFFGDDPALITKNIRSDMVDKVQVYEKKSDLADRTGIDDGELTQTIDIRLKEDKKKGMFGQALAGLGTDKYYGGRLMANYFKGSRKVAVYGIAANDGMVGLNFEDGQKYGIGSSANVEMTDGGGIMIYSSGESDGTDSWSGQYYGNGVPRALNTGASYSDKSKGDKHKININFKHSQLDVENNSTYMAQNNLPEVARIDNSNSFSDNASKNNTANLRYDLKIDSLSDLVLKMGYNKSNRDNFSSSNADQRNLDNSLVNETFSTNKTIGNNENVNADILLTRRFNKARRTITLNANINAQSGNSVSNFYSLTEYNFDESEFLIDQLKDDKSSFNSYRASLTYTEPFSKRWTGTIGYNLNVNDAMTLNESYNKNDVTGEYDNLDQDILNDFENKSISNGASLGLNYKGEKITLNFSNQLTFDDVSRQYNNLNHALQRDQISWRPSASITYKITKSKSLNMRYNGRSIQPNLSQIEPLKQNSNQLVDYLDNPDLKAGFSNSLTMNYNSYKQIQDKSLYGYLWINQTMNNINSKVNYFQNSGRSEVVFVNIDKSNWSMNGYVGHRFPLVKKIGLSLESGLGLKYSNAYNYLAVNGSESQLNNSERYSVGPSMNLQSYRANKWSIYASINPGIQFTNSTLQPDLNSRAFALNTMSWMSYTFPKDFTINLNLEQEYEAATKTLDAFNRLNATASISKKFLKDKSLEAQIFVNDIFNKNTGVRRWQSGYQLSQTTNDVLQRYGMFKLIYNFTTMKGAN